MNELNVMKNSSLKLSNKIYLAIILLLVLAFLAGLHIPNRPIKLLNEILWFSLTSIMLHFVCFKKNSKINTHLIKQYTREKGEGYDLNLISTDSFQLIRGLLVLLGKKPYLIKNKEGKYKIWGYKEGTWQMTDLGNLEIPFEWTPNQTVFVTSKDAIFNILKNGHHTNTRGGSKLFLKMIVLRFIILVFLPLIFVYWVNCYFALVGDYIAKEPFSEWVILENVNFWHYRRGLHGLELSVSDANHKLFRLDFPYSFYSQHHNIVDLNGQLIKLVGRKWLLGRVYDGFFYNKQSVLRQGHSV